MIRFFILIGFAFMFFMLHYTGDINKYINMKYAYLSISAVVIMGFLGVVEFVRFSRKQAAEEKRAALAEEHQPAHDQHDHSDCDSCHANEHNHEHHHDHDHGHSHEEPNKLKRYLGYAVLFVPIFTGLFFPAYALDSSFVKAKGFSFPTFEQNAEQNPGNHQFLKPDSSIFYNKDDYKEVAQRELEEFVNQPVIKLTEADYLKGMEAIYNDPAAFMNKTIAFDGFAYKGTQVDGGHYFVFRFGFIHCVADSGVFGMLADFPKGTQLADDDWVHVSGKLTWELYQPFKQTIPVLKVTEWSKIDAPKDPYVYRS
ncbi:TIGR03943 family putative permease subunit [Paenibacillus harenae]|uniref:TIGR03943 family putative permease subunit n=1 Tax=Paenibacillus harenae TaxID=306543 RepID=UPI00278E0EDA|nr:TIGR03943 family protein [Paenibacillus harenae]MDQ0057915.1 putative membrane protein [Paenibacillus harenae]